MKTILAALCVVLLCVVSAAQAPTKTTLPPKDPSLEGHVPSFSTKRRVAKPFQAPGKPAAKSTVPGTAPAARGLAPSTPATKPALPLAKPAVPRTVTVPPAPATPQSPTPAPPVVPPASTTPEPTTSAPTDTPMPAPSVEEDTGRIPVPPGGTTPTPGTTPGTTPSATPSTKPSTAPAPRTTASTAPTPGVARRAAPTGKAADYHLQYKEFFVDNLFTDELVGYWQEALANEPERSAEIVQESAAFAAEAIAAGFKEDPLPHASIANALAWLEFLFERADETAWTQVGDAIGAAFSEDPARVAEILAARRDADSMRTAMQTCLTLALYGNATELQRWITFSDRGLGFLNDGKAFLFGGEALNDDQYDSLLSLFNAVPREVHQVLAVIVPEGTRIDVAEANLRTPGVLLNIYASSNGLSLPDEFYAAIGTQPVAPQFTLEAAAQLVRAAQYVQFSLRPELVQRRDLILRNAGLEPTRYLRRSVPPAAYLAEPDELLPQTAYLWFIDSATAFQQAGGLLRFNENEAMDAVLLLADMLSGGTDQTFEFRTEFNGRVTSRTVPIERTEVEPGLPFASGLVVGGQAWRFGFARDGGVTREASPVGVVDEFVETPTP